jgi:PadR family transcriptional regulator, regulatory protein PadR
MFDGRALHDHRSPRKKGLLKTWMGEATPQRGGRAKRIVRVTSQVIRAAKELYDAVMRVSRGASWTETRIGWTS